MSQILKAYLENEKGLRKYVSRLCARPQDVDDLLQETFLKGFASELKVDITHPKAFLFKVATNLALMDRRKKKAKPAEFLEDFGGSDIVLDESQIAADSWIDGRRKLALFAKAVAHLTPQCRRAFLLRRIEGLQYKQIADRMNISVSAVEKHVANGLLKCNAYLRAQGYDPSEFGVPASAGKAAHLVRNDGSDR
jgi:RNA polymerase sigma-70 factor (ECF subfamily)